MLRNRWQHPSHGQYTTYRIPYYDHGQRKFHKFADYARACAKANEMLEQLLAGQADAVTLSVTDKAIYLRALDYLKPTGTALDAAAQAFAAAAQVLNGRASLLEAVRFYMKHNSHTRTINTAVAIDEFIRAKQTAKRSVHTLHEYEMRLNAVKKTFGKIDLDQIGSAELKAFFETLGDKSARSFNNYLAVATTFFRWATKQGYLPSGWKEIESIEWVNDDDDKQVTTLNAEEVTTLLAACSKSIPRHPTERVAEFQRFIAIGAFAGLRTTEILALDWSRVGVDNGKYIDVWSPKVKGRRLVPMQENLKAWLNGHPTTGPVWPETERSLMKCRGAIVKAAGIVWPHNALRHSYISYRVAETSNVAQTALEAGNSPEMVFHHYRALKTPEQAKAWFAVTPPAK